MEWLALIGNALSKIPVERVLFPPRDNAKALEKFVANMPPPQVANKALPEQKTTPTMPTTQKQEAVATACVPCALGHFSTSAGLFKEMMRFKSEGITSNEILDRIAMVLEEQNTLERVDLTEEKIRALPDWERDLAEEALNQSRSLRHRLESLRTMEDLQAVTADTAGYYRTLNRAWWKGRFANTGKVEPELTLNEAKQMAAALAAKEVESRWTKEKSTR